MATARRQTAPRVVVLESGNVLFFYRPVPGFSHPQSSDEVEHAYLVLHPDDQSGHQNRVIAFTEGVFPPVILDEDLPEERAWAVVLETSPNPLSVIAAIENVSRPQSPIVATPPLARLVGRGRYSIVRKADRTYFAYVLAEPSTLGAAQHMLLMEQRASYQVLVSEPFAPSGILMSERPSYPEALGEKFAGRMTVPADPTDFLDFRGTRLYVISETTDLAGTFGIHLEANEENEPVQDALMLLADIARREQPDHPRELFKPMETGAIV